MDFDCKKGKGWRKAFKCQGFRFTLPREIIIDVLYQKKGHLSIEEIFFEAHKINSEIGLTTVYRTLDILNKMGVVNKFDFGDGRARYEFVEEMGGNHHHHLVCASCKKIIDYTDFINEELIFLKKAEEGLSSKYNFKITGHMVRFYGLCEECKDTI